MNKIKFTFIILVFTISHTWSQFPAHVDSVYTFMKYNSIHTNYANWTVVDSVFKTKISAAKNLDDTMNCFVYVLENLNDVHSYLILNNKSWGYYKASEDENFSRKVRDLYALAIKTLNTVKIQLLPDHIGYIRVPGFSIYGVDNVNYYSQALRDSVNRLIEQKATKFILDLRLNSGGNLYPMIAGLSTFLGNKPVGYSIDSNDSIVSTWEVKNGNFYMRDYQLTSIADNKYKMEKCPLVILTSPLTASSGAMNAIVFKGRGNVKFIGEPTASGYTTSNGYFQFAPNFTVNFATNFVADRNKNIYKDNVVPDVYYEKPYNFDDIRKDSTVLFSIDWLKKCKK